MISTQLSSSFFRTATPIVFVLAALLNTGCETQEEAPPPTALFSILRQAETGIAFSNTITEDLAENYMIYESFYQGAGVAVGDINNDGLADIYFAGNQVENKLYLNKGDMKFEDISAAAGVRDEQGWSTGVSMVDINDDGFLDIYVCKFQSFNDEAARRNRLFINNGDLTFTESASKYGLADAAFSTQASFFDYDKDGDLDLYLVNQPPSFIAARKKLQGFIDYRFTDHFFENNGDLTFTDKTQEVGIVNYAYGLAATIGDLNNDGWPDVYVACDYDEPDLLYINNGNKTFTNTIDKSLRHISNFSMGVDVADINNDGMLDVFVADMVAEDNKRLKSNMSGMNPEKFWELAGAGYHLQYMFNSLQLNRGRGQFSEIGQLAGVSNTDWSWSALLADFDNDGWKDLYVTNGQKRDVRNNDFVKKREKYIAEQLAINPNHQFNPVTIMELAPSVKVNNYIYRNEGDLSFSNKIEEWGLSEKQLSHGAAYADFDMDGDIDIVLNNMDEPSVILKNNASDGNLNNYLRIQLAGVSPNRFSIGAKVSIETKDGMQYQEISPARAYMSASESVLHFGVGKADKIEKVQITWVDGTQSELTDVASNQLLKVDQAHGKKGLFVTHRQFNNPLFEEVTETILLDFAHVENKFNDFKREILLPHKMSTLGPSLASADLNGDGLDDFFIGGASGSAGAIFIQQPQGGFVKSSQGLLAGHAKHEDVAALFFDADQDGDQDLIAISGGNEFDENHVNYTDRLYLNDGKGNFTDGASRLPKITTSGGAVAAADYDQDGDLDLFIGSRQVPGKYPHPPASFLLRNDNGKFTDVTSEVAPDLASLGMVTTAIWSDFNSDKKLDLMVAGEWMAITLFENKDGKLVRNETDKTLATAIGWWNRIEQADFDIDGDMDYVVGNLGRNIKYKASAKEPFEVFCSDFDDNGTLDIYLAYYNKGVCYPVRGRQCSSQQMPVILEKFPSYDLFSEATVQDVLGEAIEGALHYSATNFETSYLENLGGGNFKMTALPVEAQISVVSGIIPADFNGDGNLDLLLAGNYYHREVETTRSDASVGLYLEGDGAGKFSSVPAHKSGFYAMYDARDIRFLRTRDSGKRLVVVANNGGKVQVFSHSGSSPVAQK